MEAEIPNLPSNFPFVGITRDNNLDKRTELKGFNVDRTRIKIGSGPEAYRRAKDAIQTWQNIDFDWFFTNNPPVKPNTPVVVTTQTLLLWSLLPLRVTWVDNDGAPKDPQKRQTIQRRMAFGHATVEGHQLSGEERFAVELHKNGDVYHEAVLVSKPASLLSMVSLPMLRLIQMKFMSDSTKAMKAAVAGA